MRAAVINARIGPSWSDSPIPLEGAIGLTADKGQTESSIDTRQMTLSRHRTLSHISPGSPVDVRLFVQNDIQRVQTASICVNGIEGLN
jgi:hypothetical protein